MALDTLAMEHAAVEATIFDTRSASMTLKEQLESPDMADVKLILAYCSSQEIGTFAYYAATHKIPFINTNLPIDGGVYNNPYYVMLNSTLRTHVEGIYRHLQKYNSLNPIIVFRHKGQMENIIKTYFDHFGENTAGVKLPIKFVDLPSNFTGADVAKYITEKSTVVAGSLDEKFALNLTGALAQINETTEVSVIGMPTWDGIKDFNRPEFEGLEITYSTPFYNARQDTVSKKLVSYYQSRLYARPSDLVLRGYEATYRFIHLLMRYPNDLDSNITRKEFNVFREYDIQPVFLNKENMTLDYFENKKLFFIKWLNGETSLVP